MAMNLEGNFAIVLNADVDEYDEVYLAARVTGDQFLVVTTTEAQPAKLDYYLLECRAAPLEHGGFRVMIGVDAQRAPPMGVPMPAINL
eukprot:2916734-Lingulodinium_polyedra.AAC.1